MRHDHNSIVKEPDARIEWRATRALSHRGTIIQHPHVECKLAAPPSPTWGTRTLRTRVRSQSGPYRSE